MLTQRLSKGGKDKMEQKGILMVLSGFSGAGKGTLVKRLIQKYDNYALSVSMTTREPREGERDGVEYHFTDEAGFQELLTQGIVI